MVFLANDGRQTIPEPLRGEAAGGPRTTLSTSVVDWLLDSDPAIRWQVLCDLTDAPAHEVAAERARVMHEGWGAQLLALRGADGMWSGGAYFPEWTSTTSTLQLLRHFGLDPKSDEARQAIQRVRAGARWEYDSLPYFDGEVEPCINGQAVAIGAYFGEDVRVIVDRLLSDQMDDGGWNCEQERGSTRGSFETTINVLEGFLEYERANGPNPDVTAARLRGQEYLLERRLLHRLSTGGMAQTRWLYLAFPYGWHYDVLRVLDYLRDAGVRRDERMAEAVGIVEAKRDATGRWPLDHAHHDELLVDLGEREDEPSRWITLHALRVLRWAESAP
jgi:hypothetical protein